MSNERIINFMGQRKLAAALSILLIVVSIVSLAIRGLNLGLDFTGGTSVELTYEQAADLGRIREQLAEAGYEGAVVKFFGTERDVLVSLQEADDPDLGEKLADVLRGGGAFDVEVKRVEFIGPQVGDELRDDGGLGMIAALAVVMLYVAVRFQFKFSIGAVGALIHDVIIVLGFFSVFQWDFDLTVLAALLAVIGYSINDTIVVADRIRENFRTIRKGTPIEIINISLNQTLGRTVVTSLTTVLVLVALFYFGGALIHGFATALLIGVVVGTYSSVYVSANLLLTLNIHREDLIPPVKEGEELDSMP
jgi:preprotein translocase subunit SecF